MSFATARTDRTPTDRCESFVRRGDSIDRLVKLSDGNFVRTTEHSTQVPDGSSHSASFYDAWLRRQTRLELAVPALSVVDLFSGCGGLSVGATEAARAIGRRAEHVMAIDNNENALGVYGDNFPEAQLVSAGIESVIDGEIGEPLSTRERALASNLAGLDLALGGPPCQGNSDLNNHTRREDPRNQLYMKMARFVEVVRPRHLLIENVPGVTHERSGVVRRAVESIAANGYSVASGVVVATDFGAAQKRRRHVILASRGSESAPSIDGAAYNFGAPAGTVLDAIGDIDLEPHLGAFGTPATHWPVNQRRINYLFDNDLYNLPNSERPDCHRLKPHSYVSVYGRMRPDRPAPTITSGFGSTGQGRFVHPTERRTLTPHEAARLQGFPDWFSFSSEGGRRALQEMIGNAVPSRLAYGLIASLIR